MHHGVCDDAVLQQAGHQLQRRGVVDHERHDRYARRSRTAVEPARQRLLAEAARIRLQTRDAFWLGPGQAQRRQCGCRVRRRDAGAVEQQAGAEVVQHLDQLAPSRQETAAAGEAFRQRADDQVDLRRGDAVVLADASSRRADGSAGMRLVDHQPRIVATTQRHRARQVDEVAIHAVRAFDQDEGATVARPVLGQQASERFHVVVRERHTTGAGQHRAHQAAVVHVLVVQDQVAVVKQVADRGDDRAVAAHADACRLATGEVGQLRFEFGVQFDLAAHHARGTGMGAVAVDRLVHGLLHARIVRQVQVVVVGKGDVLAAGDVQHARHLAGPGREVGVAEAAVFAIERAQVT